ncbi:putative transposase, partial [Rhodococcus wratislaviensis IFP 2016]
MGARRKRRKPTPYPSDLTDAQWELIAPMVPTALPGGRPAIHDRRRIVEAILYVNRTGCSWRQLPHDFPPWQTVFGYFQRWNESGVTDRIHDALRAKLRDRSGRDPMASAGMVDAQAVKGADTVGTDNPRMGRRETGQRQEATRGHGLAGPVGGRAGDRGERTRPRRRAPGIVPGEDSDAVDGVGVGRRRLRRTSRRVGRGALPDDDRYRAETQGADRIQCTATPLANRTDPGVDRAL